MAHVARAIVDQKQGSCSFAEGNKQLTGVSVPSRGDVTGSHVHGPFPLQPLTAVSDKLGQTA